MPILMFLSPSNRKRYVYEALTNHGLLLFILLLLIQHLLHPVVIIIIIMLCLVAKRQAQFQKELRA